MEEIIGKIKVVLFHNEDNLYSVIKVKLFEENNKYITVTGNFPILDKDEIYKFYGEFIDHYRFGKQFLLEKYEKVLPNSKDGIVKYLSSPIFPGIGEKTALLIYERFGENSLEIIKEDFTVLQGIIKEEHIKTIKDNLIKDDYFDEAVKLFVTQGLSMKMLVKIQAIYKEKMIEIIKDNPYRLVEDIDGIGFKTADDFANKLGIEKNDERRIKAAIVYSINMLCMQDGDTYTTIDNIQKYLSKIIDYLQMNDLNYYLNILLQQNKIIIENDKIYSITQYESEVINTEILTLFNKKRIIKENEKTITSLIKNFQNEEEIEYDIDQIEAIKKCINSGLSIITGGPGTGKSTIVKALINIYTKLYGERKIFLCAPTGRASKRLNELTGYEATTIHRMLKWDLDSNTFSINEENPLLGDLLIVDEFSMVDNFLLSNLLKAVKNFSQIVFIGDDDQLPSVGPGNILKDLIDSKLFNVIKLNKIYRQKEKSNIILLAHHIKNNENIEEDINEDVVFYSCKNTMIKKIILDYIKLALENGFISEEIQVLAPMYMSLNGIENINDYLQEFFNPKSEEKEEFKFGRKIFRVNDRILQLKNQNEDDIYNGDMGILENIYKDEAGSIKVIVNFDSNRVTYSIKDLINITHAYCISVHKSQGSEYPLVIMPITNEYRSMLARNLIYTAITRAKRKLIIIGDYSAFIYGINNTMYRIRNTQLEKRLKEKHKGKTS